MGTYVYMIGILPIKKYKTASALNNSWEYSMVEPRNMDRYFGFTKDAVKALAKRMYAYDFKDKKMYTEKGDVCMHLVN